jgi:hypothetical protein
MDTFTLEKLKKDIKSSGACSLVDQAEINEIVEYQAAIDEKFIAANPQNLSQLSIPKKTYDAWMNENRIGFTSVLRARFQQEDCSRAWGRCFVTVFYAIGIGFVLFPSIRMFVTIVTAVMHTPISQ